MIRSVEAYTCMTYAASGYAIDILALVAYHEVNAADIRQPDLWIV